MEKENKTRPEYAGLRQGTEFDFERALGERSQGQQNFPHSQGAAGQAGGWFFSSQSLLQSFRFCSSI